ncbi:hypothetical protein N656DRAFT_394630 [Canariomyces notabilis]|uniref:Uncharacterized protein n=1 Tax=Canariomyces notabilis TaxID=2074819 RepID=A0AAN6TJQ6_9PEZI|nr:hypothetical protein N656DRAFT_394630 [Canariomyces arenarius]
MLPPSRLQYNICAPSSSPTQSLWEGMDTNIFCVDSLRRSLVSASSRERDRNIVKQGIFCTFLSWTSLLISVVYPEDWSHRRIDITL